MVFIAPFALAALALIGLPVWAHLRGKRVPRRVRLASMRFVPLGAPAVARRRRLEDPLLLALRVLIVLALVLTVARPTCEGGAHGTRVATGPHTALLLLDDTSSLDLQVHGAPLRSAVRAAAEQLLDDLPADVPVGLVTSHPAGPSAAPALDRAALRGAIAQWYEGPRRRHDAPLQETVTRAGPLVADAPVTPVVLYAIGDRSSGGPSGLDVPWPVIHRAVPDEPMDAAVTHTGFRDMTVEALPGTAGSTVRLIASVQQVGAEGEREVDVELWVGDTRVNQARVTVGSAPVPVEFTVQQPSQPAPFALRLADADKDDDPFAPDNAIHGWLELPSPPQVVIVNGSPSERRLRDEAFYLATALASHSDDLQLRAWAPEQLALQVEREGQAALDNVSVLVLANVPALSEATSAAVAARIRQGLGVWILAGDRFEPQAWTESAATWLPGKLGELRTLGTAVGRHGGQPVPVRPPGGTHPAIRAAGELPAISRGQATRALRVDPNASAATLLALEDGTPLMVSDSHGAGRVLLSAVPVDLDWSDLPLQPGFVPLVDAVVRWLGDAHAQGNRATLVAGKPRVLPSDAAITLRTPEGRTLRESPSAGIVKFRHTDEPGHYTVQDRDGTPMPTADFVVNLDAAEAQTLPVEAAPDSVSTERTGRTPAWAPWAVLATLAWLAETLLRLRARSGTSMSA